MRQAEKEEIIRLINDGIDLELLSFELEIPIEQVEEYKEQLELRKTVKEFIKNGKIQDSIEKLNSYIKSSENNIVERMMLLKLQAYIDRTNVSEEDLIQIEEERKKLGFSKSIDEIIDELGVQIPKRKSSNLRKKEKLGVSEIKEKDKHEDEEIEENDVEPRKITNKDYKESIKKYKEEIAKNPQNSLNKRNLLAFALFKAGRVEEARDELFSLVEQYSNYTTYKQLIHLEKSEKNFEDAKLWANDCLEKFPESIEVRQQLISIAREEKDNREIIKQLKEINRISPNNKNTNKTLATIENER